MESQVSLIWHITVIVTFCLLDAVILFVLFTHWKKRRAVESKLKESEERMRMAARAGKLVLWIWEILTDEIWTTPEGRAMFNWPEDERINLERFRNTLFPGDRRQIDRALQSVLDGGIYDVEYRLALTKGTLCWVHVVAQLESKEGKPVRLRGAIIDITAHKEAQFESEQRRLDLLHLSRAEVLGQISSSLTHEINQPLSAILTNTQVAMKLLNSPHADPKELLDILGDVIADSRRANEIIIRLRGWLKKEKRYFEQQDLSEIIEETVRLLRSELMFHRVVCSLHLASPSPKVVCDRIQIQQVLVNLIKNAWEVLQSRSEKTRNIVIRTALQENGHWAVSVNNNGGVIPDDVLGNLFRPYVSTKATGLGVGLSICRTIIETHGGRIWAENERGVGATFCFTLPVGEKAREITNRRSTRTVAV